jgi:hypothetical protein
LGQGGPTGSGIRGIGGADGHGIHASGGATTGDGIRTNAPTDGHGIQTVGVGAKDGIRAQGGATGSGIRTIAGADGIGFRIQGGASSGNAMELSSTDTGFFVDGTVEDVVPPWNNFGSGNDTLRMYAYDTTTAIDAVVANVLISAVSPGNNLVAQGTTNASGYADLLLVASTDYIMSAVGPDGNYWHSGVTKTNDAGLDKDTVFGWTLSASVPAATQVCATSFVVRKSDGTPHEGVRVTVMMARSNIRDSSGYAVSNIARSDLTDATGTVTFNLRWSSYLIPATDYRITVGIPGGVKCTYTVPRETSQTVDLDGDCNN